MATTSKSGRSPTWPLFFAHSTNVDGAGAGFLRRLEGCRSSVSCSNPHPAPALRIGIGTGRGTETATVKEKEREEACLSGGNTVPENETEYEEGDCECECNRPCDCDYDSGCECGCECKTGNPVGKRDIKPTSKTSCVCARYRDSIRAERRRRRQRQRQKRDPASPTTAASIAAQRQHQHRQVQNPSLPPPQPPQPPPPHTHQPSMPPPPRFASCGHSPPPFPTLPSPSSTTTSLSGYCRPCDFTNTRRTILRISEHYEEQIADLETRIEKAKVELFRTWNDYLGERKDLAIRAVERLKEIKEEECQGAWREFDERWGGKAVGGGGA